MKHYLINWKTTISGLCVFGLISLYLSDQINKEQMETVFVVLTGLGFILAKDSSNK